MIEEKRRRAGVFFLCLFILSVCLCLRADAQERRVERTVTFSRVEAAARLPQELELTVRTEDGETEAVCALEDMTVTSLAWDDSFTFPITFYGYGSQLYRVNETLLALDEEGHSFAEWEPYLLELLGLSSEDYRISGFVWDGEPYLDAAGQLCRDAAAVGEKRVKDLEVSYAGLVEVPGGGGAGTGGAAQEAAEENGDGREGWQRPRPDSEDDEAQTPKQEPDEEGESLLQRLLRMFWLRFGLAGVLFLIAILLLLSFLIAGRIRKWYTDRKKTGKQIRQDGRR